MEDRARKLRGLKHTWWNLSGGILSLFYIRDEEQLMSWMADLLRCNQMIMSINEQVKHMLYKTTSTTCFPPRNQLALEAVEQEDKDDWEKFDRRLTKFGIHTYNMDERLRVEKVHGKLLRRSNDVYVSCETANVVKKIWKVLAKTCHFVENYKPRVVRVEGGEDDDDSSSRRRSTLLRRRSSRVTAAAVTTTDGGAVVVVKKKKKQQQQRLNKTQRAKQRTKVVTIVDQPSSRARKPVYNVITLDIQQLVKDAESIPYVPFNPFFKRRTPDIPCLYI